MASADTSAAPNSTTLPGEVSGIVPEVSLEKDKTATAITDAQNSTTLPGEVSGVVPDGGEKAKATTTNDASNDNDNVEQTTTDAPNNTSLPGEVSGVVPDTAAEKKDAATPTVRRKSTACLLLFGERSTN